jgi:CRP-like cAMP-binding protein
MGYSNIMSAIYEKEGRFKEAFYMKDSALELQEIVFKRNDAIKFSQVEKKIAIEEHMADIKFLESEKKRSVLLRNAIILVVLLFLIIAAQLFIRQRILYKKNQELLKQSDKQLNIYIESIKEKNLMINEFRYEVEELNNNTATIFALKEKEEIADKLKKYTILTEVQWDEFRHLFEKVHNGFFDKLRKDYPSLTQSEIRILALLKLNLSRKEMAEMLGISPDSITKTRQRIKKKIEMPDAMDLDELVVNI